MSVPQNKYIIFSNLQKHSAESFWEQFATELLEQLTLIYLNEGEKLVYKRCFFDKQKQLIRCLRYDTSKDELQFPINFTPTKKLSLDNNWTITNISTLSALFSIPCFNNLVPANITLSCGTPLDFSLDKITVAKLQSYPGLPSRFAKVLLNANIHDPSSMEQLEDLLTKLMDYPTPDFPYQVNEIMKPPLLDAQTSPETAKPTNPKEEK